jgi:4-hydroxy-2-oxoheptanedioate aldolase
MPYCSMPAAQYIREANEQTFVIIQIEEEAALEHIDGIFAVDGVDAVFLGPGDFSALGGYPGQLGHPRIEAAVERIAIAARRAGKHWGRPVVASAQEAERYLTMGARFLGYSSDLQIIKRGLEEIQRDFSAIGFEFDNRLTGGVSSSPTLHGPHKSRRMEVPGNGMGERGAPLTHP